MHVSLSSGRNKMFRANVCIELRPLTNFRVLGARNFWGKVYVSISGRKKFLRDSLCIEFPPQEISEGKYMYRFPAARNFSGTVYVSSSRRKNCGNSTWEYAKKLQYFTCHIASVSENMLKKNVPLRSFIGFLMLHMYKDTNAGIACKIFHYNGRDKNAKEENIMTVMVLIKDKKLNTVLTECTLSSNCFK